MREFPANLTSAPLRALPALKPAERILPTGSTVRHELILEEGEWSPMPQAAATAILCNRAAPGPTLTAVEGDLICVDVHNRMTEPTAIHFHGVPLPHAMDGVPGLTQAPVEPGQSFRYRFFAPHAGTYMYHSHMGDRAISQIGRGLYGAMVVRPRDAEAEPAYDVDRPLVIGTWRLKSEKRGAMGGVWAVNGMAYPHIPAVEVREGDLVRLRLLNVTQSHHPMHLHGHDFRLIAEDGHPLAQPRILHTVDLAPGKMIDVDFLANNPGEWLLHCHNLMHMMHEGGLAVKVRYQPRKG